MSLLRRLLLGPETRRVRLFGSICGFITLLAILLSQSRLFPASQLFAVQRELQFADLIADWGKAATVRDDIVFLGIDEDSLDLEGPLFPDEIEESDALKLMLNTNPFPREVWAMVIERVLESGARVVVLDLFFHPAKPGDAKLHAMLAKYADRVVIASKFSERQIADSAFGDGFQLPADSVLSPAPGDPRIGYANFWVDEDDRIRTIEFQSHHRSHRDRIVEHHLVDSTLRQIGQEFMIPNTAEPVAFRYARSGEAQPYAPIPLYTLFHAKSWEMNFRNGETLADKIVVIGPSASILQDKHQTPRGILLGPQIHINALAATLNDELFDFSGPATNALLVLLMGMLAFSAALGLRRPITGLAVLLGVAVFYVYGAIALFNHADLMITGVAPVGTFLISGLFCFGIQFAQEKLEKARFRRELERFLSPGLARVILNQPEGYYDSLGGVRKYVTILFSDIRGFTAVSENTNPKDLLAQLNEYFAEMVDAVHQTDGIVDKFIGDAVMAMWGDIHIDSEEIDEERAKVAAENAVRAALSMRQRLVKLNERWETEGRGEFAIGIGINFGVAVFGNVGSEKKKSPTVLGDSVNLASRLEGLTKHFKEDIIVSEEVACRLPGSIIVRPLCGVGVKGKQKAVPIYSVVAGDASELDAGQRRRIELWNEALDAYRAGDFEVAEKAVSAYLEVNPGDPAAETHLERIRQRTSFSEPVRMTSK